MIIIADTNILVRLVTRDNELQFNAASNLLKKAEGIIIPTPVFCELEWVLSVSYKLKKAKVLEIINGFLTSKKVTAHEEEIEAGLQMMEKGGDFTDGVNAYTGRIMAKGLAVFASFDKQAVRLLTEQGISAMAPE